MSTGNANWSDPTESRLIQRVAPWRCLGVAIIVAVAATLVAVGALLIRQVQVAELRGTLARSEEANQKLQQDIEQQTTASADHASQAEATQSQILELQAQRLRLQASIDEAATEIERLEAGLEAANSADRSPAALPAASLRDLLPPSSTVGIELVLAKDDLSLGISQGAILEFTKKQLREKLSLVAMDSASTQLVVRLIPARVDDDVVALTAMLELRQIWKVPGSSHSATVALWSNVASGYTYQSEQLTPFAERVLANLFTNLQKQF